MLESGHSIADYQIVTPLTENPLFGTYQVTGPGVDSAKLLLIAPEQLAEKKIRQTFTNQVKVLLGQSFPGLCCLLDATANDEYSYCLYPFPSGKPLEERLSESFTPRRSLEIIRTLALHLASSHAAGLWHGSISPATIYLDGDAVALDLFAFASLLRLDFHSGIDPCYSSPELVRGESLDTASDLYSLGVVLYRLLTGDVPFSADDPFATAMLHVQESPDPLPVSLAMLQPLIDNLLQTVPNERWNADNLIAELDICLQSPQLDSLALQPEGQSESVEELVVEDTGPSRIESLMNSNTDMGSRIERRLQERREILQESENLTQDAKRASTSRMSAISQQSYRKTQDMKYRKKQQKSGMGRVYLLIGVGVAVGAILFTTLFGSNSTLQQKSTDLPEALLAGLESGSKQLERGDVAAAEQTFSGLVDSFALYPQPYNNLAVVYARQGDLERSRNVLERAMATDDSYALVYRNLGTVYSEMARDSYGRALQLEKGQQAVTLQIFGGDHLVAVNAAAVEKAAKMAVAKTSVKAEAASQAVVAVAETQIAEPPTPQVGSTVRAVDRKSEEVVDAETTETEPVAEVVVAPEPGSAEVFLRRWAAAWSAQDVPAYLSFYAEEFAPSSGISREDWTKQRKSRIARPKSIQVSLEDFSATRLSDEKLRIEATQGYKSDRYADRTRKSFDLINAGDNWQIVRERSLGRVR